jgi:hypothetical protein
MNYLLAALSSPKETRLRLSRIHWTPPVARFGRLKRGNMRSRKLPSSIYLEVMECWSAKNNATMLPIVDYSITPWEK